MFKLISIDPGKCKCGLVLVDFHKKKVDQAIVLSTALLPNYVKNLNASENISKVLIGNGTTSRQNIESRSRSTTALGFTSRADKPAYENGFVLILARRCVCVYRYLAPSPPPEWCAWSSWAGGVSHDEDAAHRCRSSRFRNAADRHW